MNKNIILLVFTLGALAACSKKTPDTPMTTVPERLEMLPATNSVEVGATTQFTLKFFNTLGQPASLPPAITWTTADNSIATVNQQGIATGVGPGQTAVKATYNTISATALLTVVTNNTQLASVMIMPADSVELKLNEMVTLTAIGKNNMGNPISGLSFSWMSNSVSNVEISIGGVATAKAYGTSIISATALGIQSAPVMAQVIRKGNFSGSGSTGMAKLKIENSLLKLQTSGNFSVMTGPPDLRIYLGNNDNDINGAVEVASLTQRSGAQSWNVALPTTITQYRYVIVWCKQFGGTYGVADLGN
ncbi:MAG: DM13 domain-containing protein [Chitinophagaceae bacterium]